MEREYNEVVKNLLFYRKINIGLIVVNEEYEYKRNELVFDLK